MMMWLVSVAQSLQCAHAIVGLGKPAWKLGQARPDKLGVEGAATRCGCAKPRRQCDLPLRAVPDMVPLRKIPVPARPHCRSDDVLHGAISTVRDVDGAVVIPSEGIAAGPCVRIVRVEGAAVSHHLILAKVDRLSLRGPGRGAKNKNTDSKKRLQRTSSCMSFSGPVRACRQGRTRATSVMPGGMGRRAIFPCSSFPERNGAAR